MYNENEWFADFAEQLNKAAKKPISEKEAIKNITEQYFNDVGLSLLAEHSNTIKTANVKNRSLSKRASYKIPLRERPEVIEAVDSFCRNSGGNKSTYSILSFLRGLLGKESISYTDKELIDYINERKKEFSEPNEAMSNVDVGKAGTEHNDFADTVADYASRGR